ncbi:hypothetical protein [Halarchaeum nitratireducens]|uniref:Uncharacterized protein n=1 Tax=Halarchaeum nitratireducens TaxID=489913 RepID=A0A830GB19_9EURY|nr:MULTISPECIES: hypothetical protein [Halarchaeum]MBP2252247.1 hypothetical protein [Halarchaeum solikamskense]GGN17986.1 hypothetical protein GCM10009021_18680 [Halarchaeum nitratireducens]
MPPLPDSFLFLGLLSLPESVRGPLCAFAALVGVVALVCGYALAGFGAALAAGVTAYGTVPLRVSLPIVALGCALLTMAYGCWRLFRRLLE